MHEFVPVAMESLGPINGKELEFLQELGRHMTEATGDPRELTYLFQFAHCASTQWNLEVLLNSSITSKKLSRHLRRFYYS